MLDFFLDNFYVSNDILNTSVHELEFSIIDFETTGLYPYNGDRIVEVGIIRAKVDKKVQGYESFINPEIPIPENVTKINKITDEMVSNAPLIEDKIDEITGFIDNSILMGQNLSFDVSFLNFQLQKMGRPKLNLWMLDTIKIAKLLMPELERYSLAHLTKALKVVNKKSHRAITDADATYQVFQQLLKKISQPVLKDLLAFKIH